MLVREDAKLMSFTLIDLDSQLEEVSQLVHGWSSEQILSWLGQNGMLEMAGNPYDPNAFVFTSTTGIKTALSISDDGHLTVVRHHTTHRQK